MLGAIAFVTRSYKGCCQVDFGSEYGHVSSVCLFSYFGIYRQVCVRCENEMDKFDVSTRQMNNSLLKYEHASSCLI
jgi:hypothetical protein